MLLVAVGRLKQAQSQNVCPCVNITDQLKSLGRMDYQSQIMHSSKLQSLNQGAIRFPCGLQIGSHADLQSIFPFLSLSKPRLQPP